jgi:GNAT superfamily N-acetyltransferase
MEYQIRGLTEKDINEGLFDTLLNLNKSLNHDFKKSKGVLKEIKRNPNHKIFVAVSKDGKIIGLITLLIEPKLIENFGKFGHIEDVVVRKDFEKHGIGSALVRKATETAKGLGCYQVRLCCSDLNMKFYEKQGYKKDGNSMIIEFNN